MPDDSAPEFPVDVVPEPVGADVVGADVVGDEVGADVVGDVVGADVVGDVVGADVVPEVPAVGSDDVPEDFSGPDIEGGEGGV